MSTTVRKYYPDLMILAVYLAIVCFALLCSLEVI